ncbi:hypothetical protein KTT_01330 [Tengunoibacter tsumagoiensis]|uniref:J domain-containing protein n=2 Tax=Tengunoibacter tsumagoiensis TaxID=2014871 RepID=A0A401ZU29_9CHLR|nr:hypothetical protein KTT_01330 [Tengunoibacter tsumagoiensis]
MPLPDYYAILDVSPNATLEQIRQSYRRLARIYHPDVNRHAEEGSIKQLNEAYDILSNMAKRNAYDLQRLEEIRRGLLIDLLLRQREQMRQPKRMTWVQGMTGFVSELKKEMRSE